MTTGSGSTRPRRELYVNTLATWGWAQGTLISSVVALPLLTRFLPKAEFGLWAQMLSLSALATVADFGMSSVFLRHLTGAEGSGAGTLGAANRFYGLISGILAATLSVMCFVPGGLLEPFVGHTHLPGVAAAAVIAAIVVNLAVQPYSLRLLSQGRMDLEGIFGAGPAILGSFATVPMAYWFHSAVAVGIGYAAVEIGFDVAVVVVVRRLPSFKRDHAASLEGPPMDWRSMFGESWGVLVVGLVPLLTPAIDATIVGHIDGAVAVAVYAVAIRVSDLVRRLFSPFTQSLFVSLCRTTGAGRATVERHAGALPWVILTSGFGLSCLAAAVGAATLKAVFGPGYGGSETAIVLLLVAATIRTMYMPGVRWLQADGRLGSLPRWFLAGLVVHVALAIVLTMAWSIRGTAAAVLIAAVLCESWPVSQNLRRHLGDRLSLGSDPALQMWAGFGAGGLVLILTWLRLRLGGLLVPAVGALGLAIGAVALGQIVGYLRSSRSVTVDG